MSLDMVGEPERNDRRNAQQGQPADEALTPEIRELLADLALNSESHTELSDVLAEKSRALDTLVERHPEFNGAAKELQMKMTRLRELENELGMEVMRFSLVYEDAQAEVTPVTGDD